MWPITKGQKFSYSYRAPINYHMGMIHYPSGIPSFGTLCLTRLKVWQPVLALRDQLKSGRVTIARAKYVDKESVGISPEVYLYIIISRL